MDANRSVLTLLKLLWMSFASFALACEKDDPDCGIHEKQNPPSIRTCKWQILKQDLTVFIPSIQTIDVEASCPMDPFGDMHIDECINVRQCTNRAMMNSLPAKVAVELLGIQMEYHFSSRTVIPVMH